MVYNGPMTRPGQSDEPVAPDHADALLDEALDESFPASDPPSMTRPHDLDDPSGPPDAHD